MLFIDHSNVIIILKLEYNFITLNKITLNQRYILPIITFSVRRSENI